MFGSLLSVMVIKRNSLGESTGRGGVPTYSGIMPAKTGNLLPFGPQGGSRNGLQVSLNLHTHSLGEDTHQPIHKHHLLACLLVTARIEE